MNLQHIHLTKKKYKKKLKLVEANADTYIDEESITGI